MREITVLRSCVVAIAAACIAFAPVASQAAMTLHPGDKISINVYNHPELLTQATVDASGSVTVPLAGTVSVRGADAATAAERIRAALAPYVRYAAVDVQVQSQGTAVYVVGGPGGVLSYAPGETLGTALGQIVIGGGVDLKRVTISRDGSTLGSYDANALAAAGDAGPLLAPGDTITLANKPIAVAVRGEVKTPGLAHLESGESLNDAVNQAGGYTLNAGYGQVQLKRGTAQQTLSLGGGAEDTPRAQDGDVLVVPPAEHVSVVGMVEKPGEVVIHTKPTLLTALYYAGGPVRLANLHSVSVVHDGVSKSYDITGLTHGDISQNATLADGDVVVVPKSRGIDIQQVWQALAGLRFFVGL